MRCDVSDALPKPIDRSHDNPRTIFQIFIQLCGRLIFGTIHKTALVESIVDLIERVILISIEMKMFEAIFVPSWFRALSGVDNNLKFHRLL